MKKRNKNSRTTAALLALAVIVILSNTPPAQYLLLESYSYTNGDGSFHFSEEPAQALDFKVAQIRWERFKKQYPGKSHVLYRTFEIRPWQFWEWWQYLAHGDRFVLPYKSP